MINKVIHALEANGFTDMTLIDVKAIRGGIDPKDLDYSVELAERYMNVAKLEIVLDDKHVKLAKETILKTASRQKGRWPCLCVSSGRSDSYTHWQSLMLDGDNHTPSMLKNVT